MKARAEFAMTDAREEAQRLGFDVEIIPFEFTTPSKPPVKRPRDLSDDLSPKSRAADDDGEDGTKPSEGKGAKRKRAPPTKGPCEHGVKKRSACKVCSGCPHGRLAHSVQGVRWCINL